MIDISGRKIKFYVTDICNESCLYCPIHGIETGKRGNFLNSESLIYTMEAARNIGFTAVKFSGEYGDCITREDIGKLIYEAKNMGYREISIATNGIGLINKLDELLDYGLNKICLSLDTLKHDKYKNITKVDALDRVKEVAEKAVISLGNHLKLNMVVLRNLNDEEIDDMIKYSKDIGATLQIIEMYKVKGKEELYDQLHVDLSNLIARLDSEASAVIEFKPRKLYHFLMRDGSRVEVTSFSKFSDTFGNRRLLVHPNGDLGNYDIRKSGYRIDEGDSRNNIEEKLKVVANLNAASDIPGKELWEVSQPQVS